MVSGINMVSLYIIVVLTMAERYASRLQFRPCRFNVLWPLLARVSNVVPTSSGRIKLRLTLRGLNALTLTSYHVLSLSPNRSL